MRSTAATTAPAMPIHLPAVLVNPLALRYVADDVHVIAFFSGHAHDECVEAMLSARADGTHAVRAILTGHDQRQVDHVNDDALLAMAAHADRATVRCDIDVAIDLAAALPRAEIRFTSHRGEAVELSVVCAFPPDATRGGLTDPGTHALETSLPIMLRTASAMAGAASRVSIAGRAYAIPEKLRAGPHVVAHHGYFSRGFHMAALRCGTRKLRLLRCPATLAVGQCWVYETDQGRRSHEIVAKDADGLITIATTDRQPETVRARPSAAGLELIDVRLQSPRDGECGVAIAFAADGTFTIGIDAHRELITGVVRQPAANALTLRPQQPAWATQRALHVQWHQAGDLLTIETRRAPA
jgi:hypothetical protein